MPLNLQTGDLSNSPLLLYLGDNRLDIIFAVQDSGIGIPEDQQQHIFEAFQQQEGQEMDKYGGTGLGLAICLRFVEMMGGKILLESETGKGSTFRILLKNVAVPASQKEKEIENKKTQAEGNLANPLSILKSKLKKIKGSPYKPPEIVSPYP